LKGEILMTSFKEDIKGPGRENITILKALQENCRSSFRSIAKKVGLSPPTVAERIARMEETGIIKGYAPRINATKAGFPVQAIVSMHTEFKDPATKIFHEIAAFPEVLHCWRVTGDCDYVLHVAAVSMEHMDSILLKLSNFGKTRTSVVLDAGEQDGLPWEDLSFEESSEKER